MKLLRAPFFLGHLLAACLLLPAGARADDPLYVNFVRSSVGPNAGDGDYNFQQTSPGAPLTTSVGGSHSHGCMLAKLGGFDFSGYSLSRVNYNDSGYIYGEHGVGAIYNECSAGDEFTITTDPALDGQLFILEMSTYLRGHLSGSADLGESGANSFAVGSYCGAGGGLVNGGYDSLRTYPQPLPSTVLLTTQVGANSAGAVYSRLLAIRNTVSADYPRGGQEGLQVGIQRQAVSAHWGPVGLRDDQGQPIALTGVSKSAGALRALPVPAEAPLSTFSITNVPSTANGATHGTVAKVLDGVASEDRYLKGGFSHAAPILALVQVITDVIVLEGMAHAANPQARIGKAARKPQRSLPHADTTPGDLYVLELSLDEAAVAAAGLTDADITLQWLDPVSNLYKDAYFGDSDGGAARHKFTGAYQHANFALGNYGVDPVAHTVWAVIDHDGEFVAGKIVNPLKVISINRAAGGVLHLHCLGLPNVPNLIEASSTPDAAGFDLLTAIVPDAQGNFDYDDPMVAPKRFYRLALP